MPWNKNGDTGATHPALMRVAGLPGADVRAVNEVAGFFWRLTMLSSAHTTDHVLDAGTVAMIAGPNLPQLVRLSVRAGLLTKIRDPNDPRLVAYQLLDDPEFVHIRTRAEIEWTRQQKADTTNPRLAVPIRLRDGDQCRYCQVVVYFGGGRPSARKGTLDHLEPGQPGTVGTMLVACMTCNSALRAETGDERLTPRPPPFVPFYSASTARWLTRNGHPVTATDGTDEPEQPGSQPAAPERPGSQPGNATPRSDSAAGRGTRTRNTRTTTQDPSDLAASRGTPQQRPGSRPGNAALGDGHPGKFDLNSISQPEEIGLGGSGREGPGARRASHPPPVTAARRRSRGQRQARRVRRA